MNNQKKRPKVAFFQKNNLQQFSKRSAFSFRAKTRPNIRDKSKGIPNHPEQDLTLSSEDFTFANLHTASAFLPHLV